MRHNESECLLEGSREVEVWKGARNNHLMKSWRARKKKTTKIQRESNESKDVVRSALLISQSQIRLN